MCDVMVEFVDRGGGLVFCARDSSTIVCEVVKVCGVEKGRR